ncbi:MAG TPA: archease, partial [Gemmataceae bacterium]|nr:archease [Gemmataceae bacterium]
MYETFEHTADLGLRIRTPDLDRLFVEAAEALFSVIVEDLATVQARQQIEIELAGQERDYLLFDWLKELLY